MKRLILFVILICQLKLQAQLSQNELFNEEIYWDTWKVLPIDWMADGITDLVAFQFDMGSGTEHMVLYVNDGNGNFSWDRILSSHMDPNWSFDIQSLTHEDIDNNGIWEVFAENWFELFRLDYEVPGALPLRIGYTPGLGFGEGILLNIVRPWLVDFDQDGDLDLAVISPETAENLWLINDNGFEEGSTTARTGNYYGPSEDWNGDGLGDHFGATPSQTMGMYNLRCYLQQLDGTYNVTGNGIVVFQFPASWPSTFVFEDLNADGLNDLLLQTNTQSRLALRQVDGTFGPLQDLFNLELSNYKQLFSDYDGDGDKDIVLNSQLYSEQTDYVVFNFGSGSFGPLTPVAQTHLRSCWIMDLDTVDGKDMVGVYDARAPFAQIIVQPQFENNFNGPFQSLGVRLGFGQGENVDYHVSDLDQDGEMDIYRSETFYPYGGAMIKSAYTDHPTLHSVNDEGYSYFLIDRDPDLDNEVMAYHWQGNTFLVRYGILDVVTNTVNLISESTIDNTTGFLTSPKAIDLNSDGEMDLLFDHTGYLSDEGAPIILLANSDGSFEVVELPLIESETVLFAGCFDLNNDGQYEYYLADDQRTYRMVYDAMGNWSEPTAFFDLPILLKHRVEDEVNGQPYIIAAIYTTNACLDYYLKLLPDGTVEDMRSLRDPSFPNGPWTVNACFDIDGDGFDELISSAQNSTSFWITHFQSNDVSWQTVDVQQRQLFGSSHLNYEVLDINCDGTLDMYVADNPFFEWFANSIPFGCTDALACNYSDAVFHSEEMCCYTVCGCTDELACNYDPSATCDNGTCTAHGCTNPDACNFDPVAICDDGTCNLDAINLTAILTSDDINIAQTMFSLSFQSQLGNPEPNYFSLFEVGENLLITEFHCIPNDCYLLNILPIAGYSDSGQVELRIFDDNGFNLLEEINTMEGFTELGWWYDAGMVFCICGANEIAGCTNPEGFNYSPEATCEDGSCTFTVQGRVYHDVNANGVFDTSDYGLPFQQLVIEPDNVLVFTDDQGYYSLHAGIGNCVVSHVADATFPYYSTSISYSGLSQDLSANSLDFGLSAVVPIANVCLDIYPDWYLCDDWVNFSLCFRNLGNYPISGSLAFTYDDLMTGYNAVTPIDSVVGNTVYFSYANLLPGQMFFYDIQLHTPTFEWMGENVSFAGVLEGYYANVLAATGYKTLVMEHACSYDPNDKIGYPIGYTESHFVEDGTAIEYVVRFQNTGNAPALNVRIEDQLDENLDLSTFELVANSHSVLTVLDEDQRGLTFYFNNIMLPDSATDEPGSNGLVSCRIALKDPLPTGTEIHNTASIYFDNNPAVVTNTTLHTIYNCEDFVTDLTVDDSEWCDTQTLRINTAAPWADAYIWSVNGLIESESEELLLTEAGEKHISLMVDNPLCGLFEESITLNIDDLPTQSITASATSICEGETADLLATYPGEFYSWSINDQIISTDSLIVVAAAGTYELTTTMGACVQTNSIDIVVTPMPQVNITQSMNVLTTLFDADWTYQWYLNNEPIAGAVSSAYEIVSSGTYAVQVSNGTCMQSMETNATFISVTNDFQNDVGIYPNPTRGDLMLTNLDVYIGNTLMMYDLTGRVIFSEKVTTNTLKVKTQEWAAGLYRINLGNQMHLQFVKLDD